MEINIDNKGQGKREGLWMRYGWIFVTCYNPFYFVSKAVLFLQIAIRKMNPWGAWSSSEAEQLLLDEPQMIVSSLKKMYSPMNSQWNFHVVSSNELQQEAAFTQRWSAFCPWLTSLYSDGSSHKVLSPWCTHQDNCAEHTLHPSSWCQQGTIYCPSLCRPRDLQNLPKMKESSH